MIPAVSLLIAMRNEEKYISSCINSLLAQDYSSDYLEIIVVDGDSEDASKKIVENLLLDRSNSLILDNPHKIQSAAWNIGLKLCSGEIISIVSGHAEFAPDYVSRAVETLVRTGVDMVGGTVRAKSGSPQGETIALAMSTSFGVGGARFRYTEEEEETDTVFMGFCRREVYSKIGGYDEELIRNQDDEFSYRLLKAGGHIVCNPRIVSYYYNRVSLRKLWDQYFQYGFWKVRVLQKHPRQMRLRQFVPLVFVLALLLSALFAYSPQTRPLSIIIPLVYLATNLFASLRIAMRHGWQHFPILPLTFAILHLSYGLGFLLGLIKFANRWGDKIGNVPSWNNEVLG